MQLYLIWHNFLYNINQRLGGHVKAVFSFLFEDENYWATVYVKFCMEINNEHASIFCMKHFLYVNNYTPELELPQETVQLQGVAAYVKKALVPLAWWVAPGKRPFLGSSDG
jgi:hypothetical protein